MRTAGVFRLLAVLALCGVGGLRAHDPFEISSELWIRSERLELTMTMTRSTAVALCSEELGTRRGFGSDEFESVRKLFESAAPGLVIVGGGAGGLAPKTVAASMSVEGDLEFRFVYPRPESGPLVFRPVFLQLLREPEYGTQVTVLAPGMMLAFELMRAGDPALQVPLPTVDAAGAIEKKP